MDISYPGFFRKCRFKDTAGRDWEIAIDALVIERVRSECDPHFMLGDSEKENTYMRLEADPVLLCRVIYLLCDKQRTERSITEADFYSHVIGSAIEDATAAILDAIVNFTPPQMGLLLRKSAEKISRLRTVGTNAALAKLNDPNLEKQFEQEMDAQLDAAFAKFLTPPENVTSTPALSESAQGD